VREHSSRQGPCPARCRQKEAAERTVSIRRLGKEDQQVMSLDTAIKALTEEAVPPDVRRMNAAA
jgi:threonyl-tRNA synthetase